jgi:hypothetical protein
VATDPAERTQIRLAQVYPLLATQGSVAAVSCLEEGLAEISGVDAQLAMRFEAELALQYTVDSRPDPVVDRLGRHRDVSGDTSAERFVLALLAQQSLRRNEPCAVTRELALRALAGGRLLQEESGQAISYYVAAAALIDAEA